MWSERKPVVNMNRDWIWNETEYVIFHRPPRLGDEGVASTYMLPCSIDRDPDTYGIALMCLWHIGQNGPEVTSTVLAISRKYHLVSIFSLDKSLLLFFQTCGLSISWFVGSHSKVYKSKCMTDLIVHDGDNFIQGIKPSNQWCFLGCLMYLWINV